MAQHSPHIHSHRKSASAPKQSNSKSKILLERVIGSTASSNSNLSYHPSNGEIAYPSGCVVVTYDPKKNSQTRYLVNSSNVKGKAKPISSICFDPTGKYLAAAEFGHNPSVLIWDLESNQLINDLKGHALGVVAMAFSRDGKKLITAGSEHDQQLIVWDVKNGTSTNSSKITSKVHAVAVLDDSNFVTAGLRHFTFWNLNTMESHSAFCHSYRTHEFVDVSFIKGDSSNSYLIAASIEGSIFKFDVKTRNLTQALDTNGRISAITILKSPISPKILVACKNGAIRAYDCNSLEYIVTLPKPNPIGNEMVFSKSRKDKPSNESSNIYADVVALRSSHDGHYVCAFYNSKSLFIWDVSNLNRVGKYRSFLFHSSCIWGVDVLPFTSSPTSFFHSNATSSLSVASNIHSTTSGTKEKENHENKLSAQNRSALPCSISSTASPNNVSYGEMLKTSIFDPNMFATCSADGTIRFWEFEVLHPLASSSSLYAGIESLRSSNSSISSTATTISEVGSNGKGIYSQELCGIISTLTPPEVYTNLVAAGPVDGLGGSKTASITASFALQAGIRTIKFSPDAKVIASGDKSGNIRIHQVSGSIPSLDPSRNIQFSSNYSKDAFPLMSMQEAHESDVLCMAFNETNLESFLNSNSSSVATNHQFNNQLLLASGSRDRLIHVFAEDLNAKQQNDSDLDYQLVSTIEDHSASITSIVFSNDGNQLYSSSADKSIILRQVSSDGSQVKRFHNFIVHGTVFDMKAHPQNSNWLITAGQDKKILVYDTTNGKVVKSFKTESECEILKLEIDPTGLLLVTISQDRLIRVYNFSSGEVLATMSGHSEMICGIKFSNDLRRIVTVAGDGCIFIWKLSSDLVHALDERRKKVVSTILKDAIPEVAPSKNTRQTPTPAPTNSIQASSSSSTNPSTSSSNSNTETAPHHQHSGEVEAYSNFINLMISPSFLPAWAKDHYSHSNHHINSQKAKENQSRLLVTESTLKESDSGFMGAKGYWAKSFKSSSFNILSSSQYAQNHGRFTIGNDLASLQTQMKRLTPDASVPASLPPNRPPIDTTMLNTSIGHDYSTGEDEILYFETEDESHNLANGPGKLNLVQHFDSSRKSLEGQQSEVHTSQSSIKSLKSSKQSIDGSSDEECEFKDPSDFLHQQTFGKLDELFVPSTSFIQGRKSISAKYFLKKPPVLTSSDEERVDAGLPPSTTTPNSTFASTFPDSPSISQSKSKTSVGTVNETTSEGRKSLLPTSTPNSKSGPAPNDKKEQMAKEVEKTRARLKELGITYGPKVASPVAKSRSSSAHSIPSSSSSPSPTSNTPPPSSSKGKTSSSKSSSPSLPAAAPASRSSPKPTVRSTTPPAPASLKLAKAQELSPPKSNNNASNAKPSLMKITTKSPLKSNFSASAPVLPEAPDISLLTSVDQQLNELNNQKSVDITTEEIEEYAEVEDDEFEYAQTPRPAFISSLISGFETTLDLYRELKQSKQQDELLYHLRDCFAEMKSSLDILCGDDQALMTMASNRTFQATGSSPQELVEATMLERYSELLVGIIKAKLVNDTTSK